MIEDAFAYLRPLVAPLSLRHVQLAGTARFGETPLTAHYLGGGRNLGWLTRLLFHTATTAEIATDVRPWQLRRTLRNAVGESDIVLTELPPVWSPLQRSCSDIVIPAWIRQEVTVVLDAAGTVQLPREVARKVARHIRRHDYRLELTRDAKDIESFYTRFYLPYIRSRFRHAAGLVAEETFLRRARGDTLAKLLSEDGWVAGMLLSGSGDTLRFGWFGAISDPPPPGASAALDALCMQHAAARGMTRVVLGNSRPCLTDGVVAYKQQFGARIVPTRYPQVTLGIGVLRWSSGLIRCLHEQPLIGVRRGRLFRYGIDERGAAPVVTTELLPGMPA
jgi:hypothetical protein